MNEQLTRSDIRTMARKAADYITFNCDGVSEGFEITQKGYTIFVDYSARLCNDEMSEFTEVPMAARIISTNFSPVFAIFEPRKSDFIKRCAICLP